MIAFIRKLRARSGSVKNASPRRRSRWRWLSILLPVAAALAFYFWYTSARILQDPIELGHGPGDAVFLDTMGPLLGAEFTGGNDVKVLINGARFFPEMIATIRMAKKTITLETYIWSRGKVSDEFIDALMERARAGVKVHVLADGMGSMKLDDKDQRRMKEGGVEFVMYAREHWWDVKPNINQRTHRKILVVDGQVGFTGGMCIDDRWQGDADSPEVWRETQVRIEGPAVRQLQAAFAMNWLQTTGHLLVGPDYFPKSELRGSIIAHCYRSGRHESPENARNAHMLAIASARKTIRIAQAYFVPDDYAIDMLLRARERGVEIEVIVPAINDSRIGRAASRSRWGKLLEAGVKMHLYEPAMYHCKVMIVDDVFATVGSVNFDNRSFSINDEVALNVVDRNVAAELLRSFESDKRRSKPLEFATFKQRPWYIKLTDHMCGWLRSQL